MSIARIRKFVDTVAIEFAQWIKATENRWLAFVITVFFMLIFRAAGAPGLSDLLGMIYLMYFLTFWKKND